MKKIIVFLLIVLILGCVGGPPIKNPQISKLNLPQQYLIENVPIYRQPSMDCGPTSLRMVFNFYGKNLSEEEAGWARDSRGTSISGMESYARWHGFEVYPFYDSKKEEVKFLLAQGYPLIVGGVIPSNWYVSESRGVGQGHFVVLIGYDDSKKIFIINDSGPAMRMEIPYAVFKEFHRSIFFYVLCIYPKGK